MNRFTSETQESNVSLNSEESNQETAYVKVVAGKQVKDQSITDNKMGTVSDEEVLFGGNAGEQIVLVAKPGDESLLDNAGHKVGVSSNDEQEADKTQIVDSSNEQSFLCPQPGWFTKLDEVSRGKVRELCRLAGPQPADKARLEKLRELFEIDIGQALEVNELFHSGRLLRASKVKLKSILKPSNSVRSEAGSVPSITRRLSWRDETGGKLEQKHELKTWHYMDSRINSANPCCQIL